MNSDMKKLILADEEEQQEFIKGLQELGINLSDLSTKAGGDPLKNVVPKQKELNETIFTEFTWRDKSTKALQEQQKQLNTIVALKKEQTDLVTPQVKVFDDLQQYTMNMVAGLGRGLVFFKGMSAFSESLKDNIEQTVNNLAGSVFSGLLAGGLGFIISGGNPLGFTTGFKFGSGLSFDTGGIVPGEGPVPATVHGGERIISKEVYREHRVEIEKAASGQSGGGTVVISPRRMGGNLIMSESEFRHLMRSVGYKVMAEDAAKYR